MIIVCESCRTKFRLDPERLKGGGRVRCSRCGNVFKVDVPVEEETIRVELSDEPFHEEEERPTPPPVQSPAPAPPRKGRGIGELKGAIAVVAGLLLLGLVGFWLTRGWVFKSDGTAVQQKGPSTQEQQPVVTILDSTHAYFLENTQAGQLFLVEGEVINESARPVSFVLLEGRLYSKGNQVAQSQRCYAGNLMTRDELAKLSMNDIQNRMMNREGKELSNVHIPVGKKVPFLLVFHNLPELDALSDYTVEIISSKFE
ncbi:MAG: zinc-ribbon domain-containing protein [Syntrophobacteraceae bacterium]|jgi:predicted Zn finger-like uncharacterized protein|nr:zinc-ribbon domain-containing protein [Syntrophobacteraceae bacterium]